MVFGPQGVSAPRAIVVWLAGSPKSARTVKPVWRPKREQERWRPAEAIPRPPDRRLIEREALRERARKMISEARPRIEAMLKSARAIRIAARERKIGVPFIAYYEAA
jgi:hypothetical protein